MSSGHSVLPFRESGVPQVIFQGVSKDFAGASGQVIRALSELNLEVEHKECLAIVGPSGSGKTTVLRLVAGLEEPACGKIFIGGSSLAQVPPQARDVAMVFQTPALYPHMSVRENLGFGLKLRRWPREQAEAQVTRVAEVLGLTPRLEALPSSISGGERQRVAIGRALARQAGTLLLDEPLANIDPPLRLRMIREISDLRKRFDTTMLYVTHDHLEAMLVGDRVAVLSAGVLQQVAEPAVLYRRPANLFVAGFFGSPPMNLFPGRISQTANGLAFRIQDSPTFLGSSIGGKPPGLFELEPWLDKPVILGVRAEDIQCKSLPNQQVGPAGFTSKLLAHEQIGSDIYLRASWQGNFFVARVSGRTDWKVGQESHFDLDLADACYFDPATGKAILR